MNSYNKKLSSFIFDTNWLNGYNFINNLKIKIINNISINYSLLKKIKSSKIVIFGRGSYLTTHLEILKLAGIKLDIAYYLDNNDEKVSLHDNIYHPNNKNINKYPILIASSFSDEIYKQLKNMGAKEIYFIEDLFLKNYDKKMSIILLKYILYFQMPMKFSKIVLSILNSYNFISELDLYKHTNFNQEKVLFNNISQIFKIKSKRKYIIPLLIYLQDATIVEVRKFLLRKDTFIKLDYHFFALLHNGLTKVINPHELCTIIKYNSCCNQSYSNSNKLKLFFYISLISRVHNLDTTKYFSLNELVLISDLPTIKRGLYFGILLNLLAQYKTKQKLHSYIITRLFKCSSLNTIISKKPKVALCISGQLRGYKEAFESINKYIINNKTIEVDTYVHSWVNIGARQLSAINIERLSSANNFNKVFKEISQGFTEKELQEKYFSLNNLICKDQLVTEEELKLFYNTPYVVLEDDHEDKFKQMTNSEKMYYKMYEVNKLVKESKKSYDIVIRIRPDIKIEQMFALSWKQIIRNCNLNNTVYGDSYTYALDFSLFAMSEAVIIGSQRNMDIYNSTWGNMKYFQKNKIPGDKFQAHEAGAFRLWMSNAKMETLKNFIFSACNQKKLSIIEISIAIEDELKESICKYDKLLLKAIHKDLKHG